MQLLKTRHGLRLHLNMKGVKTLGKDTKNKQHFFHTLYQIICCYVANAQNVRHKLSAFASL